MIIAFVVQQTIYAPRAHPAVTEVELNDIRAGGALVDMGAAPSARPIPGKVPGEAQGEAQGEAWTAIKLLLRSRMMLGIFLGQYCISRLTYFFLTWFLVYLVQQRGMSILKAGLVASIPAICGFAGGVLGGVFSDALLRDGVAECVFSDFQTCQNLARLFANANTGQTGGL